MKADMRTEQSKRKYFMKTRAEAAVATEERILAASLQLFREQPYNQISLENIASQAQVTVQTVIRRFGSKERLFRIVSEKALYQAIDERNEVLVGNIDSAVEKLIDHYENWGDLILHFLTQAKQISTVNEITEAGRTYHHQWVEHAFFPLLKNLSPSLRHRRLAQLIAMTDIHLWKVFRSDLGLSREETELAFSEVITSLLQANEHPTHS
jgi:AcrR family transcriptional regulator